MATYEELEAGLSIDEHALDEANLHQADLYHRVAKATALKMSQRDAAEQNVTETAAKVELQIRAKLAERKEEKEKVTEGDIKARVKTSLDVRNATKTYLDLCASHSKWQALEKSFSQRSYALNRLVDLYVAGYFGDVTKRSNSDSMKDIQAKRVRRELHERRIKEGL